MCPAGDDFLDGDLDTVPDACDVCLAGDDFLDGDADTVPDACDVCLSGDDALDGDLDTVPDACDVCLAGDDHLDGDLDLVPDACDVCLAGDDALDSDYDTVPDACDRCLWGDDALDGDLDTVPDACDRCLVGPDHIDDDLDTVPDACDVCLGLDDHLDDDGNDLPDGCEPSLWYLSPKRGPSEGGSTMLLLGEKFDPSCTGILDGAEAYTSFIDDGTLLLQPPAHDPGLVDVTVLCDHGDDTLVGGYSYYQPTPGDGVNPDLQEVAPHQVSVGGGELVHLKGTGFSEGAAVTVDGRPVDATVYDDAFIEVVTPPHAPGVATVTVVNPDGLTDPLEGALLYLVDPEDTAADLEPQDAPLGTVDRGCSTTGTSGWGLGVGLWLLVLGRRRVG